MGLFNLWKCTCTCPKTQVLYKICIFKNYQTIKCAMFGKDETKECRVVDMLLARFSLATWRGYHGGPKEGIEKTQWEESSGRFPKPSVSVVCSTLKDIYCLITSWRWHVFLSCFCDLNCLQTATGTMQMYMKDQIFELRKKYIITWMMIAVVGLSF